MIIKEHEYLSLNKYFSPKFILKNELFSSNNNKYIIFISPNYIEDFFPIESNGNIIRKIIIAIL